MSLGQPCVTVGDYLSGVLLKELCAVQLQRLSSGATGSSGGSPGHHSFDPAPVRQLVARLAPDFASDVLGAAGGWVPAAAEVSPDSLLPDLDQFPVVTEDVEGLSVPQRRLLLEAVEIILDVFNEPAVDGCDLSAPLLPRPSLASIATQVANVLEHLAILRPSSAAAPLHEPDLDLATWERVHAAERREREDRERERGCGPGGAGSKAGLVEELQSCRQRVFSLEKELTKQARNMETESLRAKREADRTTSRLLSVNHQLEVKLKQQSTENKTCREQVLDYERRIAHEQWRLEEKSMRIEQLEAELAKHKRLQDDILVREKEYGRRVLQVHLKEFESSCRNDQRMRHLSNILQGRNPMTTQGNLTEGDLADLAKNTLDGLEKEFEEIFDARRQKSEEVIAQSEAAFKRREEEFQQVCERTKVETLGPQARHFRVHSSASRSHRWSQSTDAEVQTDALPEAADTGSKASTLMPIRSPQTPNSARGFRRLSTGAAPVYAKPGTDPSGSNGTSSSRLGSRTVSRIGEVLCSSPVAARSSPRRTSTPGRVSDSAASPLALGEAPWLVVRRHESSSKSGPAKRLDDKRQSLQ